MNYKSGCNYTRLGGSVRIPLIKTTPTSVFGGIGQDTVNQNDPRTGAIEQPRAYETPTESALRAGPTGGIHQGLGYARRSFVRTPGLGHLAALVHCPVSVPGVREKQAYVSRQVLPTLVRTPGLGHKCRTGALPGQCSRCSLKRGLSLEAGPSLGG